MKALALALIMAPNNNNYLYYFGVPYYYKYNVMGPKTPI